MPNLLDFNNSLSSKMYQDRIIVIQGEINDSLSKEVVMALLLLESENSEKISMYINSPGGSITAGMAIYDTMNHIKSPVHTFGIGIAASMGAFLLSAGEKGHRHCLPNTEVMIHQPLGGAYGQATDVEIRAKRLSDIKKRLNQILSENTGQPIETIEKDTNRDNFMFPDKALEYGLIDKVV